jgi:tRNA threonylcarbamoyl adenosine modification protein (Sua5/YciO/YrdC/YwlC family)
MLTLHLKNGHPGSKQLKTICDTLRNDGLIIYPTDTIYAVGCSVLSKTGLERLVKFKKKQNTKLLPTVICKDISQVSEYASLNDNRMFKVVKRNTPGPFTFVLPIGHGVPKLLKKSRKTIGVRIPDHPLPKMIIEALGHPILSTSVRSQDDILEYFIDPEDIIENFRNDVDIIIGHGAGMIHPSTVVDLSEGEVEIIRQGQGMLV